MRKRQGQKRRQEGEEEEMTPTELVNAMLRVAPEREPAHCHGWTIHARLKPETQEVMYTASLKIKLSYSVHDSLREIPGMLEATLRVHAEDICEMGTRLQSLADELTRERKASDTGYGNDQEH